MHHIRLLLLALAFVFNFLLFNVTPASAGLISTSQEISMGKDVALKLEQQYGVLNDPILQARVDKIGQSLVKQSARQDITYSFKVLNTNEINALAVPGGYIYLFKGLVDLMPSDGELAAVLGHEVGHIVKRHSISQIEKQLAMTLLFAIAFQEKAIMLQSLTQQALMAGYSRSDERQSDELGQKYLLAAGYNPYSMLVTMGKLGDLSNTPDYGLFSSHPDPEARVKNVTKMIDSLNIPQKVQVLNNNAAIVKDGSWDFSVPRGVGANKASYRAYLLAGGLYLSTKRDTLPDPNKFISLSFNTYNEIYYDDILLYTVYNQDADAVNTNINALTNAYIMQFRAWANSKKP